MSTRTASGLAFVLSGVPTPDERTAAILARWPGTLAALAAAESCSTCHPSRRRPRAPGYLDCAECIADHAASLALAPETVRPVS